MPKKAKFRFNPETISYERIEHTFAHHLKRFFILLFASLSLGILLFFIANYFLELPSERELRKENNRLLTQYKFLNQEIDEIQHVLTDLQQRDDNLYRTIMEAEPIPLAVRKSGYNATSRYSDFLTMSNANMVIETTHNLDLLKKQIYVQSKSYDEIFKLAKNKEEMLLHIPAIQPILNKDLTRTASGYGIRIDPIYKVKKFHAGMDFSAPTGTEIFATGAGIISFVGWKQGYGNTVIIEHGFGYKTLYGHMHNFNVKKGQKVSRGNVIGAVGNTGKSTGPHLHYEVHHRGKVANPQNYYFLDLTPEEYDKMVQISSNDGQVFD